MSTNKLISLEDAEFKSIADIYVQTLHTKYLACQHLPLPQTDSDQKAQFLPMNFNRIYLQLKISQHFQVVMNEKTDGPLE